ncbi:aminotransferase [Altererythrobacter sp. Root672]|uniref:aminotransferase n=1 Tax=Altererythrobacter sp. Root672 TaxID=1736584 RepID=UPI0006FE7506|nr:aminotransferase [Altererythrobacter sp. Root672]KRA79753.1 aminotransferase [Altererythrobacter sp. Root672]
MNPPATTIFDRMSALARELGAINLGQGFPDLPEPPELLEAAQRALVEKSNQYPPMRGLAELRDAVVSYYAREQGLQIKPEEVIVTSGATEALAAAILAFLRPGDEAILFQPFYDAYLPLVERAGGVARTVSLVPPNWTLPLDQFEAVIGPRTRLVILNTPNNPTGTLVDRATLEALGELCERHDLILLCDEVWEGMIYGGATHVSPLAISSLRERAVKVGSAGKLFSLTGWKIGWAVAAPPLAEAIARQHQYLTFTTPTPLQWAVTEGLALPTEWHAVHRARYEAGRERLVSGLTAAGYVLLPSEGTWFVTVDLTASGLPPDDEVIAERMIREVSVASIPPSVFYRDDPERGYLRLCFAKEDATLDEAIARLARFRNG